VVAAASEGGKRGGRKGGYRGEKGGNPPTPTLLAGSKGREGGNLKEEKEKKISKIHLFPPQERKKRGLSDGRK